MQQGSTALTVLVALTSVSASFLYIRNVNTQQKQSLDKVKVETVRELGDISDINTLARFRSLIANTKTPDGKYEPAIYPINYYDTEWKLNSNQTITDKIVASKGDVKVANGGVEFSQINSKKTFADLVKVLENGQSAAAVASVNRKIVIDKVNFKGEEKTLAESVDVLVTEGERQIRARIPMEAPIPRDPNLEIRKNGSGPWSRTFTNLDAGEYEIRVLASGVVLVAEVTMGGGDKITLGMDTKGNITHNAVNVKAEQVEIGRFKYSLTGGFKLNETTCQATPSDGSYTFEVKLLGADKKVYGQGASGKLAVKKTSMPGGDVQTEADYMGICKDECGYVKDWESKEINFLGDQLRRQDFKDYAWHNNHEHTWEHLPTKGYKICENIKKMSDAARIANNPSYTTMPYAALVKKFRDDGTVDGQEVYLEYIGYDKNNCKERVPLFQRDTCGCFAVGTKIRLEDGSEKPIEQLEAADRVWNPVTQKGQKIRHMTRGPEKLPLFRIQSQGQEVLVTGTHPFATREGSRPAFQLAVGDEIKSVTGEWAQIDSIQMEEPTDNPPVVWNLELEGANGDPNSHYVEANGLVTGDLLIQTQLQSKSSP